MSDERYQNQQTTTPTSITPELEAAIGNWQEALARYKADPMRGRLDAYCKATDELGQAIDLWTHAQPELAEQFKFFFGANAGS
jgi:hypothetical protein